MLSPHWLCQMAPPGEVAADRHPHTMGQVNAPSERQRMVAASLLIWVMAGQM
jgi:hypothetical protein